MKITNLKILKRRNYWKDRVEELRTELIIVANEHGRGNKMSLHVSRKLDRAILKYMHYDKAWEKDKGENNIR